jgi:hypothetical protein
MKIDRLVPLRLQVVWDRAPLQAVKHHWWWYLYRRRFGVNETQCSNCGRQLAVIPAELAVYGKRRGARLIEKAPIDAVRAEWSGFFDCDCGALGLGV